MTQTVSLVGSETLVYTGDAHSPTIVASPKGGFVAVWQESISGQNDIVFQRLDASGHPIGLAPTIVNLTRDGNQQAPSIAMLENGSFVVVWDGLGPGGSSGQDQAGVYQRIYNPDGSFSFELPVSSTPVGTQRSASVTALPASMGGGWVVTWQHYEPDNLGEVVQQRYDALGAPIGGPQQFVNSTVAGSQGNAQITALQGPSAGWLVTWEGNGADNDQDGVYQQRYNMYGVKDGEEVQVNTSTSGVQKDSIVTAIPGSGWIVAWQDSGRQGVFQQVFDSNGARIGGEIQVSSTATGLFGGHPSITMLATGGRWVVTWTGPNNNDVFQQVFNADGTKNGSEMLVHTISPSIQQDPSVVALANGDWIVMWSGAGTGANAGVTGIFQQQFHLTNPAPESVTLAGATALSYSGVLGNGFDLGQLSASDPDGGTALTYQIVDAAGNPTTDSRVEIIGNAASGYHIALKAGVTLDSSNPQGRNFSFNIVAIDQDGAHSAIQPISFTGGTGSAAPGTIKVAGAAALTIQENGNAGRDIGALSAIDPDGISALTYAVVDQAGNALANSPFEIVAGDAAGSFKLKLKPNTTLDREAYTNGVFTLYLKVTDGGNHSTFQPITVTVGNVVEAPTAINVGGLTTLDVTENDIPVSFGKLNATGGDAAVYTYSLVSTDAADNTNPNAAALSALFQFSSGKLVQKASMNYEDYANGTFTFKIHAQLGADVNTGYDQLITVNLTNVNEAPTAIDFGTTGGVTATVVKTAQTNNQIGTLRTLDPDAGDTHSYTIVIGNNASTEVAAGGPFKIGAGGKLLVDNAAALAALAGTQTTLWIKGTDAGNLSTWQQVTVNVTTASDAPSAVNVTVPSGTTSDSPHIAENGAAGRAIGVLSTVDTDVGQEHTYRIVDALGRTDTTSPFAIVKTSTGSYELTLKSGMTLDYEQQNGYTIKIETTDNGDPAASFVQDIFVIVDNVFEAPTAIKVGGQTTLALTENATPIPDFGGLAVVGGDQGFYTYSLVSTAEAGNTNPNAAVLATLFQTANGNLSQKAFLNRENYTDGTFTFKIHAQLVADAATGFDQLITVNLANVNEAPTAIDFGTTGNVTANVLDRAMSGQVIGTLRTLDPDIGDTHDYTIVTGNNSTTPITLGGAFKIDMGKLVVDSAAALAALQGDQIVWIMTRDAALPAWTAFTITVADNFAPTDIVVDGGSVAEASPVGTVAARLATTDDAGDHHTYTLVADLAGDPLPSHALFEIRQGESEIRLKAPVDDADIGSYDLFVKTEDDDGLFYIEKVTIKVTNVPEAPTELRFSGEPVAELAPSGQVVGSLTTIDPDFGGGYIYSLVEDAGGRFAIQGDQVVVKNGLLLDYEQATSHTITVRSTDETGFYRDKTIVITVRDVKGEHTAGSASDDVFYGGDSNDFLAGSLGRDKLVGGGGNDTIGGGGGNDSLFGGMGRTSKDLFVFDTKLSSKAVANKAKDTIYDFGPKYDTLGFEDGVFSNKTILSFIKAKHGATLDHKVKMDRKFIAFGDHALDRDDFFVYNKASGKLYWDVDGSGAKAQVEIATIKLEKNAGLITASDFYFV